MSRDTEEAIFAGRRARAAARGFGLMLCFGLIAGCASGPRTQTAEGPAPEARGPTPLSGSQATPPAERQVTMAIDEEGLKKSIEAYRLEKKRAAGKYKVAGADLNGDGVAEAVVLFEGKDWCTTTGCSLAIFKMEERGFKPMSRTTRVRGPVAASSSFTLGWRDLLVYTGRGAAPVRRVQLRLTSSGYPSNALLEPDVPVDSTIEGPVLIDMPAPKQGAPAATAEKKAPAPPVLKPKPAPASVKKPPEPPQKAPPPPAPAAEAPALPPAPAPAAEATVPALQPPPPTQTQ
ncbi:MAG: hypothetical protein VX871_06075 [Pseudomonadota bacterium]|nr:hypothetical protein [Pseudomonadota bacterium]